MRQNISINAHIERWAFDTGARAPWPNYFGGAPKSLLRALKHLAPCVEDACTDEKRVQRGSLSSLKYRLDGRGIEREHHGRVGV